MDKIIRGMKWVLKGAKQRCRNPKNPNYKNYGARGIKVCSDWDSFEVFLADLGLRPTGLTLERVDNEKDYCASNCRWASRNEQNQNTRRAKSLTYKGKTQSITQWAKELGLNRHTLYRRLWKQKYTIEQALSKPAAMGVRVEGKAYAKQRPAPLSSFHKGEKASRAKLSNQQASDIRAKYTLSGFKYKELSDEYAVSKSVIGAIIRNKTYMEKQ